MRISFRVKIMALIAAALLCSFALYLYLATSLIVRDKSSYIYEFNLGLARTVSDSISAQITRVQSIAQLIDSAVQLAPVENSFFAQFTEKNKNLLPESGLLVVRAKDQLQWDEPTSFPAQNDALKKIFLDQQWKPLAFENVAFLLAAPVDGKLPIAIRSQDVKGNPSVIFALLEISFASIQDYSDKTRIEVLIPLPGDAGGQIQTVSSRGTIEAGAMSELGNFEHDTVAKTFSSGVQEIKLSGKTYLAAYQKVSDTPITVLSLADKSVAFAAADTLVTQSIWLATGVLALSIIFAMIFSKGVTSRLRVLWAATKKLGAGDLSARVVVSRSRDEISDLAKSFNVMADEIQHLIQETEEKARMQSELEMAQTVQARFFPSRSYLSDRISVSGRSIPATECAGDWWQYAEIGPYLLVAIGDVTGHGVSSALVTAAAHGAFAVAVDELRRQFAEQRLAPQLSYPLRQMNAAVWAAARGSVTMTLVLSLVDMNTGIMSTVNASHPGVYIQRAGLNPDPQKSFHVLNRGKTDALGLNEKITVESEEYQLLPGDSIYWYTDGLIECENENGQRIRKAQLLRMISELRVSGVDELSTSLMNQFKSFLGSRAKNPNDDTTIVVASIPKRANKTVLRGAA